MRARFGCQNADDGVTRLAQTAGQVAGEIAEPLSEVEIAAVNEPEHDKP